MLAELLKEHKRMFFGELGQCVSALGFRAPRSDATGLFGRLARSKDAVRATRLNEHRGDFTNKRQ